MDITNKALARMCGFLAYKVEDFAGDERWAWYAADRGYEKAAEYFATEMEAYNDCVIKAGLKA